MTRKTIALLLAAFLLASLAGCQTVKGLGRDLENLGEEIQK